MEIKSKWKMIFAIVIAFIFIFEIVALGVLGGGANIWGGSEEEQVMTGTTVFSGIIRTYNPYLVVPEGVSEETKAELRAMDGVQDVSETVDGTLIETETRDDVYPIGLYLRENNLTTLAVANIAMPSIIEVELDNGSIINASVSNIAVSVVTEPIVDVDTEVTLTMIVEITERVITAYGRPTILMDEEDLEIDATVLSVNYLYTYVIAWEERNSVNMTNLSQYGEVDYQKKNTVYFDQELAIDEVMEKKDLDYVEYIDQYSLECSDDFANRTRIENDFGANITLPDSTLNLVSNGSVALPYQGEINYHYVLLLSEDLLEDNEIELESGQFYSVNSTVKLELSVTSIGDRVVSVDSIAIK